MNALVEKRKLLRNYGVEGLAKTLAENTEYCNANIIIKDPNLYIEVEIQKEPIENEIYNKQTHVILIDKDEKERYDFWF